MGAVPLFCMGHYPTPPSSFTEARLAGLTDFRCQVCEGRYPMEFHVEQDGADICSVNCAYTYSPQETVVLAQQARAEAARITAEYIVMAADARASAPNHSLMDGVSACTGVASGTTAYPAQIALTAGGSPVALVLTGIGFTSADALTASHAGITFGAAVISTDQLTWTTTVVASGAVTKGDQDFLFNGTRFPKAFRVR